MLTAASACDSGAFDAMTPAASSATTTALRRTVITVALLNLAYFGVEFSVALRIDSVALLADSIDFLEDAAVNLLILLALGLGAAARARIGLLLAVLLLVPGLATLAMAWQQWQSLAPPAPAAMAWTGLGALAVNLLCALMLARVRQHGGSLGRAAFLSARNDALANVAIIATGFITAATRSGWPDLIVGLAIAALNAGAALEVWQAARAEQRQARS